MKKTILTLIAAFGAAFAISAANAEEFVFAYPGNDDPTNLGDCTVDDSPDYVTDAGCPAFTYTGSEGTQIVVEGGTTYIGDSDVIQDIIPVLGGLGVLSGGASDTDNIDNGEWIIITVAGGQAYMTLNGIIFTDHTYPDNSGWTDNGNDVALFYAMDDSYDWIEYGYFELTSGATSDFWNVWINAYAFAIGSIGDSFYIGALLVPEPATIALFGLGLLGMGAARRRRVK